MQPELFAPVVPDGFRYRADFITATEERFLLNQIAVLEFTKVEMRGGVARRRTAHFGWTYGYDARRSEPGAPLPEFLLPLRQRTAAWAGNQPDDWAEALITEYPAGAPIGWHRDAPMFGDVAGISLLGSSRMRFRPYVSPKEVAMAGVRRATHEIVLEPRSAYLITGGARQGFEHHIPPVVAARYSITLRTLRRTTP